MKLFATIIQAMKNLTSTPKSSGFGESPTTSGFVPPETRIRLEITNNGDKRYTPEHFTFDNDYPLMTDNTKKVWKPLHAISDKGYKKEIESAERLGGSYYFRYLRSYDVIDKELEFLERDSIDYAKKVIDLHITQRHGGWKQQVGTTEYIKYP